MRKFWLAAILVALAANGMAKAKMANDSSSVPELKGKIGLGLDSIAMINPGSTSAENAPALDGRWWLNDKLGIEALLAVNFASTPTGTDAGGKAVNDGSQLFALGAGAKYNLFHPMDDVFCQGLGRVSFAYAGRGVTTLGNSTTMNSLSVTLFVGTGFEVFIPAWRAISLEASMGFSLMTGSSWSNVVGSTSQSGTTFGNSGQGFTPANVAIHYYF